MDGTETEDRFESLDNINAPSRMAMRWFIFGCIGLLLEVFFTALGSLAGGEISALSKTSPWMMLDYGLLGVAVAPLSSVLIRAGVPLAGRAFVYMLGIFFIEYVSGIAFNAVGIKIWNYSHHYFPLGGEKIPMHLSGQITFYYAPLWFALGFVVEWLHERVDAIAVMLLRGPRAVV